MCIGVRSSESAGIGKMTINRTGPIAAAAVAAMIAVLPAGFALARSYTPDLSVFQYGCDEGKKCTDVAGFRDYVTQLNEALSPAYMGPAKTLGYRGFEITYSVGFTPVGSGGAYWSDRQDGQPGLEDNPGNHYFTNQLRIRKGLPYSIQLGGSVTHMFESSLWGIGLDVSWAFVEGYRKAPDVSLAVSVGTVLGAADLLNVNLNAALIISKSIAIAGLFSIEPYAGYNLMFVSAGTHLVPGWDPSGYGEPFAVGPEYILRHRLEAGMNVVVENFMFGGTMMLDFQSVRVGGSVRVGVRFW